MIKAIIFDCFGVLTTEGWQEFKDTYFSDSSKLKEAYRLNNLADQGKLNHEQLLPLIAELAQIPIEQARKEIDDYQANKRLLAYIAENLKPNFKIGMLSNVSDDWLTKLFSSSQLLLFDEFALSYKVGFVKPAKEAYEYIADRLNVKTEECVFIDDRGHYVEAAKKLGMKGIVYVDFNQMKSELEQILEATSLAE
jgi:HAD superfamily hydrolase (TIGR01509 family)